MSPTARTLIMQLRRRNKYGVAPKEQRIYKGQLYASKAEMEYAQRLDLDPDVKWWLRQVPVQLGEDTVTRVDFLVHEFNGASQSWRTYAVDVKGMETRDFKRIKKLWAKYAPFPLRIVKRGKTASEIPPVERSE